MFEDCEMYNFVKSLDPNLEIIENDNMTISPQILEIYIPSKKFALEYCDNRLHCELFKDKNYHQNKYLACKEKGITLFQVFSDEWNNKKDIVKSMIRHRIGMSQHTFFARKCEFKMVPREDAIHFFNKCHIQGKGGSFFFGLYNEDGDLLSCLSAKNPIQKKYEGTIEISRFANDLGVSVVGGMGKLMKHFVEWSIAKGYKKILSYAELRFGEGGVYDKVGFEKLRPTASVMYWYVGHYEDSNFGHRYFRFKFRACKEPKKTEKQVATEAQVWKLHGTTNNVYLYDLEKSAK